MAARGLASATARPCSAGWCGMSFLSRRNSRPDRRGDRADAGRRAEPTTTTTATTTRPTITGTTTTGPPTNTSPPRASRAGGPLAPSRETVLEAGDATRTAAATPNPGPVTTITAPSGLQAREARTAAIPTIAMATGRTAAMRAMTTTPAGTTSRREPKPTTASAAAAASAAIAVSAVTAGAGSAGATRATTSGPTTACRTRTTGPR